MTELKHAYQWIARKLEPRLSIISRDAKFKEKLPIPLQAPRLGMSAAIQCAADAGEGLSVFHVVVHHQ